MAPDSEQNTQIHREISAKAPELSYQGALSCIFVRKACITLWWKQGTTSGIARACRLCQVCALRLLLRLCCSSVCCPDAKALSTARDGAAPCTDLGDRSTKSAQGSTCGPCTTRAMGAPVMQTACRRRGDRTHPHARQCLRKHKPFKKLVSNWYSMAYLLTKRQGIGSAHTIRSSQPQNFDPDSNKPCDGTAGAMAQGNSTAEF